MGNSLIFTAASDQYLSATGNTSINQQKFTFATWFKRSLSSGFQYFLSFGENSGNDIVIRFNSTSQIAFLAVTSSTTVANVFTSATYTDSNWHHLVVAVDTTQATPANRVIIYVDGSTAPLGGTPSYPSQNTDLSNNFASTYYIGQALSASYLSGNLAQTYYIDGQQLTPSSFISGTPGNPITYAGSYTGVFDFFLSYSNDTSTTTLGEDSSGEGNNWTLNNMTTANQSSDYPTLTMLANFVGAGNFTISFTHTNSCAATFSGNGNLVANFTQTNPLAATFFGIGNLTAGNFANFYSIAAQFPGAGLLQAAVTYLAPPARFSDGTFIVATNIQLEAYISALAVGNQPTLFIQVALPAAPPIGFASPYSLWIVPPTGAAYIALGAYVEIGESEFPASSFVPNATFLPAQWLLYIFGPNELNQAGWWQVYVETAIGKTLINRFFVSPKG